MRKLILMYVFFICCSLISFGQQQIRGKITNEQNEPLPGVTVQIKDKNIGTMSDNDGTYSVSANPNDTLVFSMVGTVTQKASVQNRSVINIVLLTETNLIDEIVIIGYGKVKKSDLTGSVGSVRAADITKITSSNIIQGLQGKVSGVLITSTSGNPGAGPVIRIRGVGTINGGVSPIFVLDGLIVNDISFINSGDIESMEVLKDASATAIYGSRGANGVILVTTKMGKTGDEKAKFSYSSEFGIQNLNKTIDLLNGKEYADIRNQIAPGSYGNTDLALNTDWQKLIFHTASIQDHQISAIGSSNQTQYYFSMGYFKQDGIIDKSHYQRITFKLNNIYNLNKNLKLGCNLTITPYNQQNAPYNVVTMAYRARPDVLPYYADGSFASLYGNVGNPLALLDYSNSFGKGIWGGGNLYAQMNIFKMFTFKSSFGIDAAYTEGVSFTPAFVVYEPLPGDPPYLPDKSKPSVLNSPYNSLSKQKAGSLVWLWENTLSFSKVLGVHSIDAVIGYTAQDATSNSTGLGGQDIIRDSRDVWYLNSASYFYNPAKNINTLGTISDNVGIYYSMISFLGRVNYSYDNKYIFTGTFRRDGSSKFGSANRYGNFPSFALGWNISKEDFMKNVSFISNLKIRGSWGVLGNEQIPYLSQYSVVESNVAVFGKTSALVDGRSYATSGNPNLKWESTTQTDIGLEFGLIKNKLTGEFDYYHKVTSDILLNLSTAYHRGNGPWGKVWYNAASVLNTGFEFKIDWKDKIDDFNYGVGILGTFVHNEVLELSGQTGADTVIYGGFLGNGIGVTATRVGLPIGAFYGYKTDGIFQSQTELDSYVHTGEAGMGDLKIINVNNDGVINANDRTYLGSSIPTFFFGFNFNCQYKGFDFSFDLQGQTGNKIFNGKEVVRTGEYNFEKHVINAWTGPGTTNTEPRASYGGYNYLPSDHWLQDGSFLRLRSLNLGYTIPSSLTKRLKIQQLRFYVKGNNLYTLTKYTGYSPEVGSYDVLSNGIDNGGYPISAVYSVGASLTF